MIDWSSCIAIIARDYDFEPIMKWVPTVWLLCWQCGCLCPTATLSLLTPAATGSASWEESWDRFLSPHFVLVCFVDTLRVCFTVSSLLLTRCECSPSHTGAPHGIHFPWSCCQTCPGNLAQLRQTTGTDTQPIIPIYVFLSAHGQQYRV